MTRFIDVACIQFDASEASSKEARLNKLREDIEGLDQSPDLIVLPELWASGYFAFHSYRDDAERLNGPFVQTIQRLAREHNTWIHGGSFIEEGSDGSMYNTSVLVDRTGELACYYRKSHIFGNDSKERELLEPGRQLGITSTDFGVVGMTICYDLRFPELFRHMVHIGGVHIILITAAWPLARTEHWALLLRARAIENQVYVIACNGTGLDHGTQLGGHSMIVDPWGDVKAIASADESILRHTIDTDEVQNIRSGFPVLDHRWLSVCVPDVQLRTNT